jgi:hypothetical protein
MDVGELGVMEPLLPHMSEKCLLEFRAIGRIAVSIRFVPFAGEVD